MDVSKFVHPFTNERHLSCFQFWMIMDKHAINLSSFVWTYVFKYLHKYLGVELFGHVASVYLPL